MLLGVESDFVNAIELEGSTGVITRTEVMPGSLCTSQTRLRRRRTFVRRKALNKSRETGISGICKIVHSTSIECTILIFNRSSRPTSPIQRQLSYELHE